MASPELGSPSGKRDLKGRNTQQNKGKAKFAKQAGISSPSGSSRSKDTAAEDALNVDLPLHQRPESHKRSSTDVITEQRPAKVQCRKHSKSAATVGAPAVEPKQFPDLSMKMCRQLSMAAPGVQEGKVVLGLVQQSMKTGHTLHLRITCAVMPTLGRATLITLRALGLL